MNATVILVEPEYGGNIGFIARAMANFGLNDLVLVRPIANHLDAEARSRAMRAKEILMKARVVKSLENALEKTDFAVATTAKVTRQGKIPRTALQTHEFAEKYSKTSANVGIVFGGEKNGLSNEDINKCDFIIHIPTSRNYLPLNLSHAAAIVFYEIFRTEKKKKIATPGKKLKEKIIWQFTEIMHKGEKIRNKKDTLASFKALIARALITEKEAKAIMAVLGSALKKLEAKKPKD